MRKIIFILIMIMLSINNASAWLNEDYFCRKRITLTGNTSGAQTDYQLLLNVTYDSDMQSDFDDLRFCNDTHQIDAWLESKVDSSYALVWVEFPTTPSNGATQDYWMYYGKCWVGSDWDIRATMLDGDDFPGSSLDAAIWDNQYCTVSVASGILTLDTFTTDTTGGLLGKRLISPSCIIESRCKNVYEGDEARIGASNIWTYNGDDAQTFGLTSTNVIYGYTYNEGAYGLCGTTPYTVDQYYNIKIANDGVGNVRYYLGSTEVSGSPITSNLPNENMYLRILGQSSYSPTIKMDWIFARKYATNPPTYAFGSKEYLFYTPPNPINLQNTTGYYWVNYTWSPDSGNVTDSYNVSFNETWHNTTTDLFFNQSVVEDSWGNISIWAYNNTNIGALSDSYIHDEIYIETEEAPPTPTPPPPGEGVEYKLQDNEIKSFFLPLLFLLLGTIILGGIMKVIKGK